LVITKQHTITLPYAQCIERCLRTSSCTFMQYDENTSLCQLYTQTLPTPGAGTRQIVSMADFLVGTMHPESQTGSGNRHCDRAVMANLDMVPTVDGLKFDPVPGGHKTEHMTFTRGDYCGRFAVTNNNNILYIDHDSQMTPIEFQ
ncbi:hypothetical protein DPMN_147156, partial [Dreissena polymorpha]